MNSKNPVVSSSDIKFVWFKSMSLSWKLMAICQDAFFEWIVCYRPWLATEKTAINFHECIEWRDCSGSLLKDFGIRLHVGTLPISLHPQVSIISFIMRACHHLAQKVTVSEMFPHPRQITALFSALLYVLSSRAVANIHHVDKVIDGKNADGTWSLWGRTMEWHTACSFWFPILRVLQSTVLKWPRHNFARILWSCLPGFTTCTMKQRFSSSLCVVACFQLVQKSWNFVPQGHQCLHAHVWKKENTCAHTFVHIYMM